MEAILVKAETKSELKIFHDLAKKLGLESKHLSIEEIEDNSMANTIDQDKTGEYLDNRNIKNVKSNKKELDPTAAIMKLMVAMTDTVKSAQNKICKPLPLEVLKVIGMSSLVNQTNKKNSNKNLYLNKLFFKKSN